MKLAIICLTVSLVSFIDAEAIETTTRKAGFPSWPPLFPKGSLGLKRVNNGEYAKEKFPFVVLLEIYVGNYLYKTCGGTIIADRWILSAAQCFIDVLDNTRATFANILIGASGHTQWQQVKTVDISDVIIHPNFRQTKDEDILYSDNDIALINVPEPIEFNEQTWPASLPYSSYDSQLYAFAVGWGPYETNNPPPLLRYIEVFVDVKNECKEYSWPYPRNPSSILCIDKSPRSEVCYDYIGGPLILSNDWEDTIIGIASVLPPIGLGVPIYFTRVLFYVGWIEDTIKQYEWLNWRLI